MKKLTAVAMVAASLLLNTGLFAEDFNIPEKLTLGAYYNNEEITITSKPLEDDREQRPVKFIINSDTLSFLGLRVGMSLDEVKKVNEIMIKAGWGTSLSEEFTDNGVIFWNCDMQQIAVSIKDGKIETISHESLPAY